MTTISVSSLSLSSAARSSVMRAQDNLRDAEKEVATGRHADVGAALGSLTGQTVSFRAQRATVESLISTNAIIGQRLEGTQDVLDSIAQSAEHFLSALISARQGQTSTETLTSLARSGLDQLVSALNTSLGGQFLFSGAQTDQKAIVFQKLPAGTAADYFDGSSAQAATGSARAALLAAQSPPEIGAVAVDDLAAFLDGPFAALFEEAAWTSNWSSTEAEPVVNRINGSEKLVTSVSPNLAAFRDLAKAFVMVADLGAGEMNETAREFLNGKASEALTSALSGLTALRADLGSRQQRLTQATERLESQNSIISGAITRLEEVDPYAASTRVTALLTQLEASYALTARIQRLSILNYL